eukprot:IDg18786t1
MYFCYRNIIGAIAFKSAIELEDLGCYLLCIIEHVSVAEKMINFVPSGTISE